MINDEVNQKAINLEIRVAKLSAKAILKAMKVVIAEAAKKGMSLGSYMHEKTKFNSTKLKDMVKKGQLENMNDLHDEELKALKKQLNKYGVNFSVMKDKKTGLYSVFFQAKDTKVLDFAFKKAVKKSERKEEKRESTRKKLDKFKDKVKEVVSKDKVKNKHHEQEL